MVWSRGHMVFVHLSGANYLMNSPVDVGGDKHLGGHIYQIGLIRDATFINSLNNP